MTMDAFLPEWIDQFLARHPVVACALVFVLAVAAIVAMLAAGQNRLVYEAF
jgi:hypothetical protein